MSETPDPLALFDSAPRRTPREVLARRGFVPVPPDGLGGRQLRGRLWELVHACAALRRFFYDTDHLNDADFYRWLYHDWLEEPTQDVPPEAEMNCHTSPADPGGDLESNEIWLRYYADPGARAQIARDEPDLVMPPHQTPPHDRDRFLPTPYPPPDEEDEQDDEDDPLGLRKVDREIRRSRAARGLDDPAQWERWERPAETLSRGGFTPLPPAEITPDALPALLWELLHELSCSGFYVLHTDHLSDDELYAALWRRALREDAILPGRSRRGGWFHDFVGSGSPEDEALYLRYYADDMQRARHAKRYPDDPLPPHESPRHSRDWRLPRWRFDIPM